MATSNGVASRGGSTAKAFGGQSSTAASTTTSTGLVQTGNSEYTAASVTADQKDALALGLVKQKDGNYAARRADQDSAPKSAAATSSAGVQAALSSLTLGG